MSISHRTNRLKLKGTPSVEKLQNGRYKLTVECSTMNSREDWYSANKARIFPDFGSLQAAEMSIDGLKPRTGEAYTDMLLTEVQSGNRPSRAGEDYVVVLTYETLGSAFVQVKDDTVNYIENGLRRVTRKSIAEVGTDFQKTIGTTSITSQIDDETAVTCILANYEVNDTDSYREVTEVYIQAGTLSETEDKVGSQLSIVKETFSSTPSTPSGYSIANEQESNVDGIPTRRFTFLKNNVVLSETEDKVGSQLSLVKEVFNGTPSIPSGYSIANVQVSDVDGIPTRRFTFLKPSILSQSEDKVGSQLAITIEAFNETPVTPTDYALANTQESNIEGIPTKRYSFLKSNVELSRTEDKVGSQLSITIEQFNGTPTTPTGYSIANETESDVDGIPTIRFTFLKNNVVLSETEDKVGSQLAIVKEVFNGTPSTPSGYELANTQESNVDGIPTKRFTFLKPSVLSESNDNVGSQRSKVIEAFSEVPQTPSGYLLASKQVSDFEGIRTNRFTFLKDDVVLSETEDKVGSQLAIIQEVFGGNPVTPTGYSIASEQESNVDGISTKRFTFLKNNVQLSQSEDKVGSQLSISQQWFNPSGDKTVSGYSLASQNTSDFEGIKTIEYRFLKEDVQLSRSVDNQSPLKTEVREYFKPDSSKATLTNYSLVNKQESNVDGIPTERYTFAKDNVLMSETERLVGSQLAIVQEVFNGVPIAPAGYSIALKETSEAVGLPTQRYTFLKDNVEMSRSEDKVGSQLAISTEVFNPTSDPTEVGYSVARTEVSDVEGIPTKRFTFLKNNVILSEIEDKVGSQSSITQEVFNGTPSTPSGYSIANEQESDVDGIPTRRFTFLKNDVMLSISEDKVGSQNSITEEWFKPAALRDVKADYSLARKEESNVNGIPTERYTFLKDDVQLSQSEDEVGSQKSITEEWFEPSASRKTKTNYSLARKEESNVEGIPTERYTFLKDNVELFRSEDKVGSQLAIVTETFNPSSDPVESGYSLARTDDSDVDGIPTKRFTFLKPSVLSRSISERNGGTGTGKLRIEVVEAFDETPTSTISGVKIGDEVSNVEGIPTRRFTFAKGEGEIRTSTRPGRIAGTTEVTAVSYGTEVVPTGVPIFQSETQENGYIQFTNTCIQGTIEEVKQTYKDVVQVEVPGTVKCTKVLVTSGAITGHIAVPEVTPRRRKTIAAQVTVQVLSTPPDTASVAYDLGAISCSVTSTNVSLTRGPGPTVTAGTTAIVTGTGFTQNFGASARIQTYPGCYLTQVSETGTVTYTTSETPRAAGSGIVYDTFDSDRQTKCIGTGSTSATGYNTTGIIKRNSRAIVTALDGVTYYEVITWSI